MDASDNDRLIGVAAQISNSEEVDWERVEQEPSDASTTQVVRELRVLERIAEFHRSDLPSDASTPGREAPRPAALGTWGHLSLRELIDKGAYGSVYRAHDPNLQTDVALKLVTLGDDRVKSPRPLKEARLLARVRHANVVHVYGADVLDDRVGIWMEFVKGQTLSNVLRAHGPLSAREAALIGRDLCAALAAVHGAGLIHGDVKARNVMREAGGRIVLMDFGTGKDVTTQGPPGGIDVAGTPLYLAPEVFQGQPRSRVTDIYSLGVLLYHLVTNAYPVEGRTRDDVENAHQQRVRSRLRDVRPDLPSLFVDTIERATAVNPLERFQSIGEFETALARFLGRTDDASPRRYTWQLAAAAVIVAAAGVGAAIYFTNRQLPTTGEPSAVMVEAVPRDAATTVAGGYRIDTALYTRQAREDRRLRPGDRVAPGDQLFARLRVSAPTYVYIVNEDERGESFLLFPLPGQAVENPISPGVTTRIPGTKDEDLTWQITSAGGREHFLIFASPERLQAFEELFARLPRPTVGKPVNSARLPDQTLGQLRGVGGLAAAPAAAAGPKLANVFTSPLEEREETARGLWVRRLTVENPAGR